MLTPEKDPYAVMISRRALLLVLSVPALRAGGSAVRADAPLGERAARNTVHHDDIARAVREGRALPLAEVLARLGTRLAGRLVRVEIEDEDGRLVYEFTVVDASSRRRAYHVDAQTAAILDVDD